MMVYDDAHRAGGTRATTRAGARWAPTPRQHGPSRARDLCARSEHPGVDRTAIPSRRPQPRAMAGDSRRPSVADRTAFRRLITDYYSYNTDVSAHDKSHPRGAARPWFQPHWVGDLTLSLRLTTREPAGQFRLELIKAGVSHRCEIDLNSGDGTALSRRRPAGRGGPDRNHAGWHLRSGIRQRRWPPDAVGRWPSPIRTGPDVRFTPSSRRRRPPPISSRRESPPSGASIEVDRLILRRDVYYTLEPAESDYSNLDGSARAESSALLELLSDPARFPKPDALPGTRLSDRTGTLPDAGGQQPLEPRRASLGQLGPDRPGPSRPGMGQLGPAKLGSPGSTLDRQGVLRLLAAPQTGLAPAPVYAPTLACRYFRISNRCAGFADSAASYATFGDQNDPTRDRLLTRRKIGLDLLLRS